MYKLFLAKASITDWGNKSLVVVYEYTTIKIIYPSPSYLYLIYFDDHNAAQTFLVRLKIALSSTGFDETDLYHVKSVMKSLLEGIDPNVEYFYNTV